MASVWPRGGGVTWEAQAGGAARLGMVRWGGSGVDKAGAEAPVTWDVGAECVARKPREGEAGSTHGARYARAARVTLARAGTGARG